MISVLIPGGLWPEVKCPSEFKVLTEWNEPNQSIAEAFVVRAQHRIDKNILERSPNLKLIVMQGVGVDHIDEKICLSRNIKIKSLPGLNADAAADWTLLLILSSFRNFITAMSGIRDSKWRRDEWAGFELRDKNIGLIGLGNVGSRVATRLQAFGAKVSAFDPYIDSKKFNEIHVKSVTRDQVFKDSDLVSLHLPLNSETQNSIGLNEFSQQEHSPILINTARGGILRSSELLEALDRKLLRCACLDVFDEEPPSPQNPILHHPKILCTPHMAGQTREARLRIQEAALNTLKTFFKSS